MPIVTDQNKYVEAPGILGMYSAMQGFTDDIGRPRQTGGFLPWADIIKSVAPVIGVKLAETIVPAIAGKVVDAVLPTPKRTAELAAPESLKPKKKKQKVLPPPADIIEKLPTKIAQEIAGEPMDDADLSNKFVGLGLNKKSKAIASAKTKNIMRAMKQSANAHKPAMTGRGLNMLGPM